MPVEKENGLLAYMASFIPQIYTLHGHCPVTSSWAYRTLVQSMPTSLLKEVPTGPVPNIPLHGHHEPEDSRDRERAKVGC